MPVVHICPILMRTVLFDEKGVCKERCAKSDEECPPKEAHLAEDANGKGSCFITCSDNK